MTKPVRATDVYALVIDGRPSAVPVRNVTGGTPRMNVVAQAGMRARKPETYDIEPLTCDCEANPDVLRWIQGTLRKHYMRRSIAVYKVGTGSTTQPTLEGYEGLLTGIGFPKLERGSSAEGFIHLKIDFEHTISKSGAPQAKPPTARKFVRSIRAGAFSLVVDGVLDTSADVLSVEPITIVSSVKRQPTSDRRFALTEQTSSGFPNIVLRVGPKAAARLMDVHKAALAERGDRAKEMSGQLTFLGPDKKTELFSLNLDEMGIVQIAKAKAAAAMKVELYVGKMDLDSRVLGLG